MVTVMLAPLALMLVSLRGWLQEQRFISGLAWTEGSLEMPLKRRGKTTKRALLRLTTEATIESARRVLMAQRKDAANRRQEALRMAVVRISLRQASKKLRRCA